MSTPDPSPAAIADAIPAAANVADAKKRRTAVPGNRPGSTSSTSTLIFCIGFAELLGIFAVWRALGWNLPALFGLHALTLSALAVVLRSCRRNGDDTSLPFLALLASCAVGPAGAIGAGCMDLLVRSGSGDITLLDDWYERISLSTSVDPVTRHCDDVGVGRAINLGAAAPASFLTRIESGSVAERQAILGLVARRFHMDYVPVLQAALRSPEPMIRVQAAAVASHIRPLVGDLFKSADSELDSLLQVASTDPVAALGLLQRFEAMTGSGLLDESDRQRGLVIQSRLGDVVLSGLGRLRITKAAEARIMTAGTSEAFERLLLSRTRFADLRVHRSARRVLHSRPNARVRRFGQPGAATAAASGPASPTSAGTAASEMHG